MTPTPPGRRHGDAGGRSNRTAGRGRRRSFRVLLAAVVGLSAIAGLAAPASAHATLESTQPAAGTAVPNSPGKVVLHFDEQVSVSPASVKVFNSSAKRIDAGDTKHVPSDSHAIETAIPIALLPGGYVVTWRVISADSHPVGGAFTFFIGAASTGGAINSEASRLLSQSSGSQPVGVLYGIVRFLAFVAVSCLLGGLLFATVIWPDAAEERRTHRILWSALGLLVVSTAAAFALEGVYGAGLGLSDALRSSVLMTVWHTRFGKAYAARLVLLGGVGVLVARLGRRPVSPTARRWSLAVLTVLGLATLATWGIADHASTGSLVVLGLPFDVIHLGAGAIWIGGLVMTLTVVMPASRRAPSSSTTPMRMAMPRFSQWALGAVVAIVATGLFATWRQVGVSWGALTTTPYGKLVLYKAGGLVVLVALASVSRTTVHGGLAVPGSRAATARRAAGPEATSPGPEVVLTSRLRNAVGAEIVIGLAVLALTAALVNARPAKQAYAAPFSSEVKAGPTLVNLVVDPAKTGPLAVHLYVLTADGLVDNVPEVRATMSNAGAGISDLKIPIQPAGPGHYVVYGFDVPIPGTWTIHVTVRTDSIDEYFADPITVHIR